MEGDHFGGHGHNDYYVDCNVLIKLMITRAATAEMPKPATIVLHKDSRKVPERLFISTKLRSCLPHEDKASRSR